MYLKAIDLNMLQLSKGLGFLKEFSFYLAGGTGLALQIGHRRSFDLDFFTDKEFSPEELSLVIKKHKIITKGEIRRHGTLYAILQGVKVSFIFYEAPLLFPLQKFNSIDVADWRDIIAEKFRTVGDRGKKKDFYDLYFGVQELGIDNTVRFAYKKFGRSVNYAHLLKGITYFEDAERDPPPVFLDKSISWEEVKDFFKAHFHEFKEALRHIIV